MKKTYFYVCLLLSLMPHAMIWSMRGSVRPPEPAVRVGQEGKPEQVAEAARRLQEQAQRDARERYAQEQQRRQKEAMERQKVAEEARAQAAVRGLMRREETKRLVQEWAEKQQSFRFGADLEKSLNDWKPSFEEWGKAWASFTSEYSLLSWTSAGPLTSAGSENRASLLEYMISKIPEPKSDSPKDIAKYFESFLNVADQIKKVNDPSALLDPRITLSLLVAERISKIPKLLTQKIAEMGHDKKLTVETISKDLGLLLGVYKSIVPELVFDKEWREKIGKDYAALLSAYLDEAVKKASGSSERFGTYLRDIKKLGELNPGFKETLHDFKVSVFEKYLQAVREELKESTKTDPAKTVEKSVASIRDMLNISADKAVFSREEQEAVGEIIVEQIDEIYRAIPQEPAKQLRYLLEMLSIDKGSRPAWLSEKVVGLLKNNLESKSLRDQLSKPDLKDNAENLKTLDDIKKLLLRENPTDSIDKVVKIISEISVAEQKKIDEIAENIKELANDLTEVVKQGLLGMKRSVAWEDAQRAIWKKRLSELEKEYAKLPPSAIVGEVRDLKLFIDSLKVSLDQTVKPFNLVQVTNDFITDFRNAANGIKKDLDYNIASTDVLSVRNNFGSRRTVMERQQLALEILISRFQEKMPGTDRTYLAIGTLLATRDLSRLNKDELELMSKLAGMGSEPLVKGIAAGMVVEGHGEAEVGSYTLTTEGQKFVESMRAVLVAEGRAEQLKAYLRDNEREPNQEELKERYGDLSDFVKKNGLHLLIIDDQAAKLQEIFEETLGKKALLKKEITQESFEQWAGALRDVLKKSDKRVVLQDIVSLLDHQKNVLKRMSLWDKQASENFYFANFARIILDMSNAEDKGVYELFLKKFPVLISVLTGIRAEGTLWGPNLEGRILGEVKSFEEELARLADYDVLRNEALKEQLDILKQQSVAVEGLKGAAKKGAWTIFFTKFGPLIIVALIGGILKLLASLLNGPDWMNEAAADIWLVGGSMAAGWAGFGNMASNVASAGAGIAVFLREARASLDKEPSEERVKKVHEELISLGITPQDVATPYGTGWNVIKRTVKPLTSLIMEKIGFGEPLYVAKLKNAIDWSKKYVEIANQQYCDLVNKYLGLQGTEQLKTNSTTIERNRVEELISLKLDKEGFFTKGKMEKLLDNARKNIIIQEKGYVEAEFSYSMYQYGTMMEIKQGLLEAEGKGDLSPAGKVFSVDFKAQVNKATEVLARLQAHMLVLDDVLTQDKNALKKSFFEDADKVYKKWHNFLTGQVVFLNKMVQQLASPMEPIGEGG